MTEPTGIKFAPCFRLETEEGGDTILFPFRELMFGTYEEAENWQASCTSDLGKLLISSAMHQGLEYIGVVEIEDKTEGSFGSMMCLLSVPFAVVKDVKMAEPPGVAFNITHAFKQRYAT